VEIDYSGPTDWLQLSPQELAGVGYFREEHCASCHPVGTGKPGIGPDLASAPIRKSAAWMIEHFKRPASMVPGTSMPAIQLSDSQLNALAAFLLKLTPRNAEALAHAPDFAVQGALLYQAKNCGACHLANGVGMKIGPPLNGLARRRTKTWVARHFTDPQALSPGSIMPPYRFTNRETENLTAYLFTLPD
jgi:mono/diheme cytochrome c family protein